MIACKQQASTCTNSRRACAHKRQAGKHACTNGRQASVQTQMTGRRARTHKQQAGAHTAAHSMGKKQCNKLTRDRQVVQCHSRQPGICALLSRPPKQWVRGVFRVAGQVVLEFIHVFGDRRGSKRWQCIEDVAFAGCFLLRENR
jgi:hypothetical protein